MTNHSCSTTCDCFVSMYLPSDCSASCSVMSGLTRSYYRPVTVQQQMVDHSGRMGVEANEEEENKQTMEHKLCSKKLQALCGLGCLQFVLLPLKTNSI